MKLKPGKNNKEERMNFVVYWAKYVKNNPDEIWSRQQKMLIDAQIANARNCKLSAEEYLKIKKERVN